MKIIRTIARTLTFGLFCWLYGFWHGREKGFKKGEQSVLFKIPGKDWPETYHPTVDSVDMGRKVTIKENEK